MGYFGKFLSVSAKTGVMVAILVAIYIQITCHTPGPNGLGWFTTAEDLLDGMNLDGKVVIVTGATSGIGWETARLLAWRGAHVFVGGRSLDKINAAIAEMRSLSKQQFEDDDREHRLSPFVCDLASLASVEAAVSAFKQLALPLHVLINNAGVFHLLGERVDTVDGIEEVMGVNHVAHFHLTNLLLPVLEASRPARVVNVASVAEGLADPAFLHHPHLENIPYGYIVYGNSKLANVMHATELNERERDKGVLAYSVHPGTVGTNLFRAISLDGIKLAMSQYNVYNLHLTMEAFYLKTPSQGAATTVYAAFVAPESLSGGFLSDCNVFTPRYVDAANSTTLRHTLWTTTEDIVAHVRAKWHTA